ncbi:matrixin family metalloprotease [Candidatus Pacearchaeota archaeon]|nr:matrixin family metalloprotease [Candidatus Pacearchaeota archaeon]
MVFVIAKPDTNRVVVTNKNSGISIVIPAHAVEVAHNVFSLGTAIDVDGRIVEGFIIVHKKNNAKPPWAGGGGKKGGSTCYSLIAKGASWKNPEPYILDNGVDSSLMKTSIDTWEAEVNSEIFGDEDLNGVFDGIDGDEIGERPDGKNEVTQFSLGPLDSNTIAYTITWGRFSGKPSERYLSEWEMVFNTDFAFGDGELNESVMDFQSIASHELGHALGLSHPDSTCIEETMYASAGYGETKKRDLFDGDIAGLKELYN